MLLGVAEYDDPGIRDLRFVNDDLVNVAAALESRGYEVEIPVGSGRLGRTRILTEVSGFLRKARHDDTLLIYLSGHGAHADQADYLLPSDADLSWSRLSDVCVPLTAWGQSIENSQASGILFLVDACREGFREDAKSVVARTGWAHDKIINAARRNVAWMFPCAPGEVARFVSPDGPADGSPRSFSLFSLAVERSVADSSAMLTLAEFQATVRAHMTELTTEFNMPHQHVRVAGEADQAFIVLPQRPGVTGASESWVTAVAEHSAWRQVDGRTGDGMLRDAAMTLVGQLAERRREDARRLAPDPWQEPAFALRMSERMEFLLGSLLGDIRLSPAEAALLVVMPFVHDAHWARIAAQASVVGPADLESQHRADAKREQFEKYIHGYPRLLRRAAASRGAGDRTAAEIGWWLFHRWIVRQQNAFTLPAVGETLVGVPPTGVAAEVFSAARMGEFIRVLRADNDFIARSDRPERLLPVETVCAGRLDEQELRGRMVGYLLVVAHRLAIETTALSNVVADHLGVAVPLVPADLRGAVEGARWEPRGSSRVLRAACPHPAAEVALREHVGALDALLADLRKQDGTDLAVLANLPGRADADKVESAESDGTAAYMSAGVRFHLDEGKVQELLMGRQLYGGPELAIREIYQNALDACRYRKARVEYLQRTGRKTADWTGRIRFQQGIDDNGNPYIDCRDNGIGMGLHELKDVFAQAGARFAELPEFLEEQGKWEMLDPPVKLYPNSRFGIGVLSYFMLADEITVETCRLGLDGLPGRQLKVSIAGPGTLFRIQDLGPGAEAGTTVRLHLRTVSDENTVSCVNAMRNILWIAEFFIEATNGVYHEEWRPGELHPSYNRTGPFFPVPGQPVWWCDGNGAILADGLKTDQGNAFFGAIVNLVGEDSPQLSVDRNSLLESKQNREIITRVLSRAVSSFASGNGLALTYDWLCEFTEAQPAVADLIFQAVVKQGTPDLEINGNSVDIARLGFFPPDRELIPGSDLYRRPGYSWDGYRARMNRYGVEPLTDELTAWRLAAMNAAAVLPQATNGDSHHKPEPVRARPSDWIILRADPREDHYVESGTPLGFPDSPRVPVQHLVAAAERLDRPIVQVADRLAELGLRVPRGLRDAGNAQPSDLIMLNLYLSGQFYRLTSEWGWLHEDERVPAGHVVAAAAQIGKTVGQVAKRLVQLGLQVSAELQDVGDVEPADRLIVSRDLDGERPWLGQWDDEGSAVLVPVAHVITAAAQLKRPVSQVARRLAALGFQVPPELFDAGPVDGADLPVISEALNGQAPMLTGSIPVPLGHVLSAAGHFGQPPYEITRKLKNLGFQVPQLAERANWPDLRIISWDLNGKAPWLEMEDNIPAYHIVAAAELVQQPIHEVAGQLVDLGFRVTGNVLSADGPRPSDRIAISLNLTGETPWLRQFDEDGCLIEVPAGHIVAAAEKTSQTIGKVAQRLTALGFQVPSNLHGLDTAKPADLIITSRDLTGEEPWLTEQLVPLGHILTAAKQLNDSEDAIARRLTVLGFDVPRLPPLVTPNDLVTISWDLSALDQQQAHEHGHIDRNWWLSHDTPVMMWHIIAGAAKTQTTIEDLSNRLRSLGFQIPTTLPSQEIIRFGRRLNSS